MIYKIIQLYLQQNLQYPIATITLCHTATHLYGGCATKFTFFFFKLRGNSYCNYEHIIWTVKHTISLVYYCFSFFQSHNNVMPSAGHTSKCIHHLVFWFSLSYPLLVLENCHCYSWNAIAQSLKIRVKYLQVINECLSFIISCKGLV